jgi:hypothetical protein
MAAAATVHQNVLVREFARSGGSTSTCMNSMQIAIMPFATLQNRTIPVAQLIQFQKLSNKNIEGTGVLNSLQQCQELQYKVAAQAMEVPDPAERVRFNGSCSRCLIFTP